MKDLLFQVVAAQTKPLPSASIRAARALLDWSMLDLANAAGLSVATIKRMEMERAEPQPVSGGAFRMVRDALDLAGVSLLTDDAQGQGVWLRRAP